MMNTLMLHLSEPFMAPEHVNAVISWVFFSKPAGLVGLVAAVAMVAHKRYYWVETTAGHLALVSAKRCGSKTW